MTRTVGAPPAIVWHYTLGRNLAAILRARELRPGPSRRGECPAVWFSARRDWEPAVGAVDVDPPPFAPEDEPAALAAYLAGGVPGLLAWELAARPRPTIADLGGLARVGVAPDTAPLSWADYVAAGGIAPSEARACLEVDRGMGSNPEDWRLSLVPVPAARWVKVQVRSGMIAGERWEPLPLPVAA